MPDFRKRVHAGETFVVAGARFAIGSSPRDEPAGLKAVAEEVGLEMVIVCGDNMGDIFRRNAFNLGLEVVQSPEAVDDARDGDELSYDRETRELANITQEKTYTPLPLTAKEDEIRRSGGIFAVGRREFPESVQRQPVIVWPDVETARGLTTTEQIVWRTASTKTPRSSRARRCACMPIFSLHRTAPRPSRSIRSTKSRVATLSTRAKPPWPTIISSSPVSIRTTSRPRSVVRSQSSKEWRSPTTRRRETGSFTSTFPSKA